MSGWTFAEPDSVDVADAAGEPGTAAAATDGAATTGTGVRIDGPRGGELGIFQISKTR